MAHHDHITSRPDSRLKWLQIPVLESTISTIIMDQVCMRIPIISIAEQHLSKWLVVIDVRPAAVVLKADDRKLHPVILNDNIRDQTRASLLRVEIYQREALDSSIVGIIVMAEQLIAATNCDDTSSILHISPKILPDCL